jgi:probable HAF family extracellular repeat protein
MRGLKALVRMVRPSGSALLRGRSSSGRRCSCRAALFSVLFTALSGNAISASNIPFVPIDLGTLGGTYSAATALNDSGQVVGLSFTRGDRHAHAFSWTESDGMIDLGTLGGSDSVALAVNRAGQVVGWSSLAGDVSVHAFLWTRQAGMIDLGTLGGTYSVATALNDSGQVVGYSGNAADQEHAFSWTKDGMIDLHRATDDDRFSLALAVNAHGRVVGTSVAVYPAPSFSGAFSWTKADGWIDLTSGATQSNAVALNDGGQVVGWTDTPPYGYGYRAFEWTSIGGIVGLGTLDDSTLSWASDVNGRGQIVGSSRSSDGIDQAFLWTQESGMMNFGARGVVAHALAISDAGQVVGESLTAPGFSGNYHAFSWSRDGGMIDLGTLGGSDSTASRVNERGQVVGNSYLFAPPCTFPCVGPEFHAVLWQPISNLRCDTALTGCNLSNVTLAGAYLPGADLRETNLKNANLTRATLEGANLTGVNLKGANLTSAKLAGASLNGANIKQVIWSNTICPDRTNSDANGGTCVNHLN